MTKNLYLRGESSITLNKLLKNFNSYRPESSVEDYLNAVTANLISNIVPEPVDTRHYQIFIHRRAAVIQTTLDEAAQKWFSVLPKKFNQIANVSHKNFSKCLIQKKKQLQRILYCEICRLPNETIKQLTVRIERPVRKVYFLNTH